MQGEIVEILDNELARQRQKIERIKGDTISEFRKDTADIQKEMTNRFEQQDLVNKDISHFISTFQKTLKAVGNKDEWGNWTELL